MNKLMIAAAAALCATVTFADGIASANVVGYQQRALGYNKTVWCCGTFQNVTKAQDEMTLADILVINPDGCAVGDVTLSFYSPKAANYKLTSAETTGFVGKSASFIYFSQAEIDEAKADPDYEGELDDVVAGWYHQDDADEWTECFNGYNVPYGSGYGVKETESGYSVQFNGTVVKDADMPTIELAYNKTVWTGNAAPKDMTLADFVPDNDDGCAVGDVTLSFYSPKAANYKLTAEETTGFVGKSASFIYFSQAEIDEAKADPGYEGELDDVVAGWYHLDDIDEWTECFNNYSVEAGAAFGIKETASGYTLDIPGAL